MRYSFEFKKKCVQMYREGRWPDTPKGVTQHTFRTTVRRWDRLEEIHGPDILKHKPQKVWTADEKLKLIFRVLSEKIPATTVEIEAGLSAGRLYTWIRKYKTYGYNGLVDSRKGRKPKGESMKKDPEVTPKPLNESEREELIRLREENAYIKAENAVIKKEIALREERYAAQLKAKKQRSSKNSGKRDTH